MFINTLNNMRPNSVIDVNSIHVLGSDRPAVRRSISAAKQRNISIRLIDPATSTEVFLTSEHLDDRRAIRKYLAELPTGTLLFDNANTHLTGSRSKAVSRISETFVSVADRIPGNHFENGSRHICWCNHIIGRHRKLSIEQEKQIVEMILAGDKVHDVADAFDITNALVRRTMERYGYVPEHRLDSAIARLLETAASLDVSTNVA